ncbi:MAG: hypothetical protein ACRYFU_06215 [Janthinobacterium lividum]
MASFADFTYEDDLHLYRNARGLVRPSVTQVLREVGIFDYSRVDRAVLERKRCLGQNVHLCTAEYDREGWVDPTWIADEEQGYFDAWLRFRRESGCEVLSVEEPMLRPIMGMELGGTPDRVLRLRGRSFVADLKTCATAHPGWRLQTALYEMMLTGSPRCGAMGRLAIQLLPDGRYVLPGDYDDPSDASAAIAALTLATWKSNHRRLGAVNRN